MAAMAKGGPSSFSDIITKRPGRGPSPQSKKVRGKVRNAKKHGMRKGKR